jgi:beta-lactamase regulating signal transducer with metallopeptidase domain
MLGGGHASGLLAVAVFLTTGTRAASAITAAKYWLIVFVVGIAAFVLAYRNLYRFESDLEDALILLRGGANIDDDRIRQRVETAIVKSKRSGILVAVTFGCFLVGGLGCCIALLMN